MTSYAVIWREGNCPSYAGKLELGAAALHLRGSGPRSSLARRDIPYADVAGVRIARAPTERLNGGPTVVLDRRAATPIVVGAVSWVGVVSELADLLTGLTVRNAVRQLARDARFWKAAAAWRDCVAGRPRIADEAYSWVTKRRR
jgi:hypothetical protein